MRFHELDFSLELLNTSRQDWQLYEYSVSKGPEEKVWKIQLEVYGETNLGANALGCSRPLAVLGVGLGGGRWLRGVGDAEPHVEDPLAAPSGCSQESLRVCRTRFPLCFAAGPGPDWFLSGRGDLGEARQGTRPGFPSSPGTNLCPLPPSIPLSRACVRSQHRDPPLGTGQRQLHRYPQLHGGERGQRLLQLGQSGHRHPGALHPQRQPPAPLLPPEEREHHLHLHGQQPRQQPGGHLQHLPVQLRASGSVPSCCPGFFQSPGPALAFRGFFQAALGSLEGAFCKKSGCVSPAQAHPVFPVTAGWQPQVPADRVAAPRCSRLVLNA